MTKREKKKPLDLSLLKGVGSGLKEIFIVAATHPAAAAVAVMTTTVALQFLTGAFDEGQRNKHPALANVHGQLNGLYDGAQKLGMAAALAPIALAGLQAASSIAASRKPSV